MIVKALYCTHTTTLRLVRLLLFWHYSNVVLVFAADNTFEGAVVCRHDDLLCDVGSFWSYTRGSDIPLSVDGCTGVW